jgi:hypothetical protein
MNEVIEYPMLLQQGVEVRPPRLQPHFGANGCWGHLRPSRRTGADSASAFNSGRIGQSENNSG